MANVTLTAPLGFRVAAIKAGIKASGNLDLGLIVADRPCVAAATFTTNKIVAPAVVTSRKHVRNGRAQAVYVNAGNANTCTGEQGENDVQTICREVSRLTGVALNDVLVCSTGIIGEHLPMNNVLCGIVEAAENLSTSIRAGKQLAQAIMTTDLKPKLSSREIKLGQKKVHISGIAKGSGMIAPNMATMLAFLTSDVCIDSTLLKQVLKRVVEVTFNKVSIDNHMSTSDTAIILASGLADNSEINKPGPDLDKFEKTLWSVCDDLARQMAADGEGANCMVTVKVEGAASPRDAHLALRAVVDSPLVRTAFNGADPNWGRIVSAIGYSGARFNPDDVSCNIAGTTVFRQGQPCRFDVKSLSRKMKTKQWPVTVKLGNGHCSDFCYTCDLSREYVTINADYHT